MVGTVGRVSEFRAGWPVVLSAMVGIGLSLSSLPLFTLGAFAPELAKRFGWGFGDIMAGLPIVAVTILVASPVVGFLSDRFGVRRVVLISLPLFALSFMTFALGTGSLAQYYATWLLVSITGVGSLPITWTRTVNERFDVSKGLALGVALLGTGLFAHFAKPLMSAVILELGWRMGYVVLGALPLILSLPLAFFFFHDADYREPSGRSVSAAPGGQAQGEDLSSVLRMWRFWVIIVALVPVSFAVAGPIPNLENILKQMRFDAREVVSLASMLGLAIAGGRIAGGWLIDHLWAPGVAFVLLCGPALACWLLAGTSLSYPLAATAIILFGIGTGVEFDLMAFLVARYFGMRSYGRVYGLIYAAFALGAGAGPIFFGRVYDVDGSYGRPLLLSAAFFLFGAVTLLGLGRYRYGHGAAAPAPSQQLSVV